MILFDFVLFSGDRPESLSSYLMYCFYVPRVSSALSTVLITSLGEKEFAALLAEN